MSVVKHCAGKGAPVISWVMSGDDCGYKLSLKFSVWDLYIYIYIYIYVVECGSRDYQKIDRILVV